MTDHRKMDRNVLLELQTASELSSLHRAAIYQGRRLPLDVSCYLRWKSLCRCDGCLRSFTTQEHWLRAST
ncbi:hypothetical protein Y1Q_0013179 [Alligator mississippiensis]|uniref:Uncharacterized protein n=1 Tax=Alligator mississippiensis TaxID=8496 RepID=A0A151NKJ9_ALLMI|nr:hypothetical protein Y1Q_0013179 [Alligator mississippiensis]